MDETPKPADPTHVDSVRNDGDNVVNMDLTLHFDLADLSELSRFTDLRDESMRAFIRTAIGNHLRIMQKRKDRAEFFLREYDPRPSSSFVLCRVEFR